MFKLHKMSGNEFQTNWPATEKTVDQTYSVGNAVRQVDDWQIAELDCAVFYVPANTV